MKDEYDAKKKEEKGKKKEEKEKKKVFECSSRLRLLQPAIYLQLALNCLLLIAHLSVPSI